MTKLPAQPHITALLVARRDMIEAQQRDDRDAEVAAVQRMEAARAALAAQVEPQPVAWRYGSEVMKLLWRVGPSGGSAMSIVRKNLLTRLRYTPYCGAERCHWQWPRTTFLGDQFGCMCGWRSSFEPEFIKQYKAAQAKLADGVKGLGDGQQ